MQGIAQIGYFDTGIAESGEALPIPSIDPAGVYYSEDFSGLLIVDSEIIEVPDVFDQIGATLFAGSTNGGTLLQQWDLSQITGNEPFRNREPTGITYCPTDQHYYITNDDLKLIFRYALVDGMFIAVDSVSTSNVTSDPEGITCDAKTGRLYVIGGTAGNIAIYDYDEGFVLVNVLDLQTTAGHPDGQLSDAEGIAFDAVSED